MPADDRGPDGIWYPYTQMKTAPVPIEIVRGEEALLFDTHGNAYIDAIASWWVNLHGHAHPYIAARVHEQLQTLEQVIFAGFTHPPALELSASLLDILPANQARIFFSDNGSTAVAVALKMAIQYWHHVQQQRPAVIALDNAYHGDTFGAMAVSARGAFVRWFEPFLFDVIRIPAPERGRESESLGRLEAALRQNPANVFIFEPLVQGAGGMLMHEPAPLEAMLDLCTKYRAVTIADEVLTGFGRTGRYFACDHLAARPDLMCLSKGLTGGTLPMGVTSCCERIHEAFLSDEASHTFFHGHSFSGNPIGCAAGLASLDLLRGEACQAAIRRIERRHRCIVKEFAAHRAVRDARCRGVILAIEIETDGQTSYFSEMRGPLYQFFLDRGVLLRPLGNVVYILPPYCITDAQLDQTYDVIREALERVGNGGFA